MSYHKPRLQKGYDQTVAPDDPEVNIQLPQELYDDLKALCQESGIDFNAGLIARLALSLTDNEELMSSDRLTRLIFCKKLAYEYQKKSDKPAS